MNRLLLAAMCSVALLGGCATNSGFGPGATTQEALRAAKGEPSSTRLLNDGGRVLFYASGPLGTTTWRYEFDAGGRLRQSAQVLNEVSFAQLKRGETNTEDLVRQIGPPWRTVRFERLSETAWDYRFVDAWGYYSEFSAIFDDNGVLRHTAVNRIEPNDRTSMLRRR